MAIPRACKSEITYIDGDKGILRYRGYPIEQLAEKSSFLEVAYLLIYGELPNRKIWTNGRGRSITIPTSMKISSGCCNRSAMMRTPWAC